MAIYLLAPLVEPVRIPSRYAEQVQRAHRDLNQQNTAPLDVGKEHLNNAVGKGQQKEDELQANLHRGVGIKGKAQNLPGEGSYGAALFPRENSCQVCGKESLQMTAGFVQLHGKNPHQTCREEALQNIQGGALHIDPSALAFNSHLKDGHHHTDHEQRPAQHGEQIDNRLHPAEVKDLHAQIVDIRKQVSNGGIKGFIQPLHQRVPDRVYDILANVLEGAAQCFSQTCQDIA